MILGHDLAKGYIQGLCERDGKNPEGVGFDVRIGKLFEMGEGEGFLNIETRKTAPYNLLAEYKEGESKKVKIEPGKIYVGQTIETLEIPMNVFARFYPRHNLFKNGILVLAQKADPNYKGGFSFVMINLSNRAFTLELGARIAYFVFHEIRGKTSEYRGQWQGGRTFIKEEEKQV